MKEKVGRCCNIYRLKKTLDNASPSIKINNNSKYMKNMHLSEYFWNKECVFNKFRHSLSIAMCLLLPSSMVYAENLQDLRIEINKKNLKLSQLIKTVENQTDYLFVSNKSIDLNMTVSLQNGKGSVKEVLNDALEELGLTYRIEGVNIILIQNKQTNSTGNKKISGTVVDRKGEAIIGANVVVKGNGGIGTITDMNGNFQLNVPEKSVLTITYIGYIPYEVKVDKISNLQVVLREDSKSLDEVVVIGYGTQKKSDITGAITQVKADDLPLTGNVSLGQMLSGKAPGMQITLNNAQPGGVVTVQIRGNAAGGAGNPGPLYVIDGYPMNVDNMEPGGGKYDGGSKSPLNNLNPADIESIEVLKDAAATSIYGARAANGVVLITTKRGKEGAAPMVKYSGSVSLSKRAKHEKMLDAAGFMTEHNRIGYENWLADNKIYPYGSTDPNSVAPYENKYSSDDIANAQTTDWLGAVERDAIMTQHNISLTGGTNKTSYYVSGSYLNQEGVIKSTGIERYSGRFNFDQTFNKYIKAGVNFSISQSTNDNAPLTTSQNENAGIIRAAMTANPTLPIYDENGDYTIDPQQPFLPNPVSLLEVDDESHNLELLGNFYLQVTPIEGLNIRMNAGFQKDKGERNTYMPKTTLYGFKEDGRATRSFINRNNNVFDITATYDKTFAEKHSFTVMGGYSYQKFFTDGLDASNSKFLTDIFKWYNLGAGESAKPTVGSYGNEEVLGSVFARLNYNYDNRYLIAATFRGDASSKFAENNKWGFFPSVALAWRVNNEAFMQDQDIVSDLKLRVSFGQTGNANIGSNALALYDTGRNYTFGDQVATGVTQTQLANPNLKWETTTEFNFGVDFGFFNNRIVGSMEYFTRRVSDLLDTKKLMSYNPINTIVANIGVKGSKGFELGLTTRNLIGEFQWTTDYVFSFYRDRWVERSPQWKKAIYENEHDMLNARYLMLSDGLVQPEDMNPDGTCKIPHMPNAKPGMIKYKDLHGRDENGNLTDGPDGKLDEADIVYMGTATSKFYVGFGNTFTYKGFDLNIFFYGYLGRKLENPAYLSYLKGSNAILNGSNMLAEVTNRWAHDNPNGKFPTCLNSPYDNFSTDFWLENANFLRCKNITLGYTLPKLGNFSKLVKNLRLYADVQNPFVITKYSGIDPEMNGLAAYPTQTTMSFGVDITF